MRIIKGKKEKKLRACIQHNKISKRHICCASSCIVKAAGKKTLSSSFLIRLVYAFYCSQSSSEKNIAAEKRTV